MDELYCWLISNTGWTWDHIDERVTLQMVDALSRFWHHTPPPIIQLKRIAGVLGIKPQSAPEIQTNHVTQEINEQGLSDLMASGLGMSHGRPNDPYLDFLD